jgi:hypothetical protein
MNRLLPWFSSRRQNWLLAGKNYAALPEVQKKEFDYGSFSNSCPP